MILTTSLVALLAPPVVALQEVEPAGANTAGANTAGANTAGDNTAGDNTAGPNTATRLGTLFDEAIGNGVFRGAVVVLVDGKTIFERASGTAETGARDTTVDSSFYLASISKQFTATAIMLLQEQQKLDYDDTVATHLPELPAWASTISIRQLLTHTSGLGDYLDADLDFDGLTNDSVFDFLQTLDQLEFEPGERYGYSNSGYNLLSQIVGRVSGQSLREFAAAHIFAPLGMTGAGYVDETQPTVPLRVTGYDRYGQVDDCRLLTNGSGGLYGSARDLICWHRAIFTAELLRPATWDQAFQSTALNDGAVSPCGFGWHIHDRESGKAVHHTGGLAGFRHFVFADLEKRNAVIMLTNGGDSFPLPAMATAVTNTLAGRKATAPLPALVDHLYAFAKATPDGLRVETARVAQQEPRRFRISEERLNELGYEFLTANRIPEATGVLAAVVDMFPTSANAYDSYGEALLRAGDKTAAVANYQKSLELDPENDNAREILERIR